MIFEKCVKFVGGLDLLFMIVIYEIVMVEEDGKIFFYMKFLYSMISIVVNMIYNLFYYNIRFFIYFISGLDM